MGIERTHPSWGRMRASSSLTLHSCPVCLCLCKNSQLLEHVPLARDRQILMSESGQVISQHPKDELWVSLCLLLLRLPTDLLLSTPASHLLLLAEHWQIRLCWAWQGALLPAETSSIAPHITDFLLLHDQHISAVKLPQKKSAASWITEKELKRQGEKAGKRRSEEGRQEGKEGINQATLPSLLQASWIRLLVDNFYKSGRRSHL